MVESELGKAYCGRIGLISKTAIFVPNAMEDTAYSQERASPKANDDTGFDDAVESLKKSLRAPIERYFAATADEQDVIALMLANIRAASTRREYQKDLRKFFVAMTGIEPNPDSVLEFLHLSEKRAVAVVLKYKAKLLALGLKEATVNRRLSSIKSLVKFARKLGVCSYTLEEVELERVKAYRDTTGVDAETINSAIGLIERSTVRGKRDYALLRLLWENLLRRDEVSKLDVKDFDPHECRLRILGKGKGTNDEWVKLSMASMNAICDWLQVRGNVSAASPLFISLDNRSKGHRLTGDGIRKIVVNYFDAAGVKKLMSPHRIRHSGITTILDATQGDVRKAQKVSRHVKLDVLIQYDDNRKQGQDEMTNLLADMID
ncbi:integrase-recombinase protein [Tolypothrix tenuis PCC 7101]|uniref:Integrase-recombinase protein n=1 Tax=Tolypothrix tenuis PCC 7101 TaxID=231146 RepID=A0A1Z4NB08_9CYAN|nr:integrase-recombinase protein [Tolypothrix tenuis PCC 7101]BAZ78241.1 integrase-recombinase protein [Aulosira laxa NIES-50]